jgi:hypothetical protein
VRVRLTPDEHAAWSAARAVTGRRELGAWARVTVNELLSLPSGERLDRPEPVPPVVDAQTYLTLVTVANTLGELIARGNRAATEFAAELQQLRLQAGLPSLREITRRSAHVHDYRDRLSPSTLSDVFRGRRLPSWDTTERVVRVLDGDVSEWRQRWIDARTNRPNG